MRIDVTTDDGQQFTVIEEGAAIDTSSFAGRSSIDGLGELFLEDGRRVNDNGDGTYQIVETGEVLRH